MFVYMFILQCLYVNMTMMLARNVLLDQKISKHDYKWSLNNISPPFKPAISTILELDESTGEESWSEKALALEEGEGAPVPRMHCIGNLTCKRLWGRQLDEHRGGMDQLAACATSPLAPRPCPADYWRIVASTVTQSGLTLSLASSNALCPQCLVPGSEFHTGVCWTSALCLIRAHHGRPTNASVMSPPCLPSQEFVTSPQ